MKKYLIKISTLLALLIFAGCSNVFDTALVDKSGKSADPTKTVLSLKINSTQVSRQILPDEWNSSTGGALIYVLTGKNSSSAIKTSDNVILAYDDLVTSNGAEFEIDSGSGWTLYLTAYQSDGAIPTPGPDITKPVLQGKRTGLDLTTGNQTVNFDLAPLYSYTTDSAIETPVSDSAGSATAGEGKVTLELDFKLDSDVDLAKIDYGIYINTNNPPTAASFTGATTSVTTWNGTPKVAGYKAITYSNNNVPAGDGYYFGALFYDSGDKLIGVYYDTLVVDGGNTTKKDIITSEAGILNKPAPDPAKVTVVTSFTDVEGSASDPTKFDAIFNWIDSSDNETGFQLVITSSDTTWGTSGVTKFDKDSTVVGGDLKAGALTPGSTTCTVALPLGATYTATLAAYNWLDVDSDSDGIYDTKTQAFEYATVAKANLYLKGTDTVVPTDDTFGMFTVSYHTKGGYIKVNSSGEIIGTVYDTGAAPSIVKASAQNDALYFIKGYNYDDTNTQSLMGAELCTTASKNSTKYPRVVHPDGSKFSMWTTTSDLDTLNELTEIAQDNKANIDVYAVWKNVDYATATFPTYEDYKDITLVEGCSDGATIIKDVTDTAIVIETNIEYTFTNVVFDIFDPTGASVASLSTGAAKGITFAATTNGSNNGASITWDATNAVGAYIAGTYRIYVKADYTYTNSQTGQNATGKMSQTVYVKLEN